MFQFSKFVGSETLTSCGAGIWSLSHHGTEKNNSSLITYEIRGNTERGDFDAGLVCNPEIGSENKPQNRP
jgi:hypothetical protein